MRLLPDIGVLRHNLNSDEQIKSGFDDYFYPYSLEGTTIDDAKSYEKFKGKFPNIDDWRRNNIDELIRETSKFIKFTKPHVKFGVSPLAIWRNKSQDPLGSETASSQTSYDNLFCDTKKWLENGWIDYVVPQLYWARKSEYTSYNKLLHWWTSTCYKGHIYIGQALYRLEESENKRFSVTELLEQIKLNRAESCVHGNIFFRAKTFRNNPQSIQDSLQAGLYKHYALIPPMKWIDSIPPCAPIDFKIKKSETGLFLKWREAPQKNRDDKVSYYVVYRFKKDEFKNLNSANHIIAIVKQNMYFDANITKGESYEYCITAVDRLHNESEEYVTAGETVE